MCQHTTIPDPARQLMDLRPEIDVEIEDVGFQCSNCGGGMSAPLTLDDLASRDYPDLAEPLECRDCFLDSHASCDDCGDMQHADDLRKGYCDSCYPEHYVSCEDCGEHTPRDDSIDVGGDYHCHFICRDCYESNYFYCEGCSTDRHNDDYGSDCRCTDCEEPEDDDDGDGFGSVIHSFDSRADKLLHTRFGKPKDGLLIGVELEVEVAGDYSRRDRAETVLVKIGSDFAICKGDGSLSNGFEIVTAPADLPNHRERWTRLLDNRPRGLKSWDTSTCGMHVHVSRKALTPLTIGKLLVFVGQNRQFIESVAGRSASDFARIHPKKLADGTKRNPNRYEAINLQNSATVEFRIFKGTLALEGVLKNIEFVVALAKFAKQSGAGHLWKDDFLKFVATAPRLYPNLSAWLRARGLMKRPNPNRKTGTPVSTV